MITNLTEKLNNFKLSHYKNADFDSLTDRLDKLYKKFKRLKDKEKKSRIILDLYTLYIQVIELLFINANALSTQIENFIPALFISNKSLRNFIEKNFTKKTKYFNWFLTEIIFKISKNDEDIKDRYILYSNFLEEITKNYLDNFDLLNAYKHGYRITAKHGKNVLSIKLNNGQSFKLNETDSTIVYFSRFDADIKGNEEQAAKFGMKNGWAIIEHTLNFNAERIFGNTLFICSLLNNIRAIALVHYRQKIGRKKISSFSITDKKEWSKTWGKSDISRPVFVFEKQEKDAISKK
ncbi:MAG: hypothetical protein PHS54_07265 [Clostridia bacterium]|nr:hypothetical protein [Clostridia bacterium]